MIGYVPSIYWIWDFSSPAWLFHAHEVEECMTEILWPRLYVWNWMSKTVWIRLYVQNSMSKIVWGKCIFSQTEGYVMGSCSVSVICCRGNMVWAWGKDIGGATRLSFQLKRESPIGIGRHRERTFWRTSQEGAQGQQSGWGNPISQRQHDDP